MRRAVIVTSAVAVVSLILSGCTAIRQAPRGPILTQDEINKVIDLARQRYLYDLVSDVYHAQGGGNDKRTWDQLYADYARSTVYNAVDYAIHDDQIIVLLQTKFPMIGIDEQGTPKIDRYVISDDYFHFRKYRKDWRYEHRTRQTRSERAGGGPFPREPEIPGQPIPPAK